MKYLKRILIILFIVIIILIVLLLITRNRNETLEGITGDEDMTLEPIEDVTLVDNPNVFYSIEQNVQYYLNYNANLDREALDGVLSDKFKEDNDVNINNVLEKVNILESGKEFIAEKIYRTEITVSLAEYFVYGTIKNEIPIRQMTEQVDDNREKFCIIVELDYENGTFDIIPIQQDLIDYQNDIDLNIAEKYLKENKDNSKESIQENTYNKFNLQNIGEEYILSRYLDDYKDKVLYDLTNSYELLEENYRQKRFGDIENYISYMEENKTFIQSISIQKYKIEIEDGYKKYICIDNNGNYFSINEYGIMNYKLQLDDYTLETDEYINNYNNSDTRTKVGMNLEKVFNAILMRDYEYVYNKLDDGFKNNYFNTIEDFKNYMKSNWYEQFNVSYTQYQEEGNISVYTVSIENALNQDEGMEKKFIMQLQEGTDFIMSFNV